MITASFSAQALRLARQPGPFGPTLRCYGELSVATAEALRRELDLLAPLARPAVILNLCGCERLDLEGISLILRTFQQWQREGRQLVLVARPEGPLQLLATIGLDRVLPTFESEAAAVRALREKGLALTTATAWEIARVEESTRWAGVLSALDRASADEALHQLAAPCSLCATARGRGRTCPLGRTLRRRAGHLDCRAARASIAAAVRRGRRDEARVRATDLLRALEALRLPEEGGSPPITANGR